MSKEEIALDLYEKYRVLNAMYDVYYGPTLKEVSKNSAILCAKEIQERAGFNMESYWNDVIKEIKKI